MSPRSTPESNRHDSLLGFGNVLLSPLNMVAASTVDHDIRPRRLLLNYVSSYAPIMFYCFVLVSYGSLVVAGYYGVRRTIYVVPRALTSVTMPLATLCAEEEQ